MADMQLLHGGIANAWECDENAHLNVRGYVHKSWECLQFLLQQYGLSPRRLISEGKRVAVRDLHIRYLREVMPGHGVTIKGGWCGVKDGNPQFFAQMDNSMTGAVASAMTFTLVLEHADRRPAPWPQAVLDAAAQDPVEIPKHGLARSFDLTQPSEALGQTPTLEHCAHYKVFPLGMGQIWPEECDAAGYLRADGVIGRISDAATNMAPYMADDEMREGRAAGTMGGAVLEYRLFFHEHLPAYGLYDIRSGMREVREKTTHVTHLFFNAETGGLLCSSEVAAVALDLKARKIVPVSEQRRAQLELIVEPSLRL